MDSGPESDRHAAGMRFDIAGTAFAVRDLEPDDEPALLAVFDAAEDWFTVATGQPAAPADVQSLYYALPEESEFADKVLLVVTEYDRPIGVIDIVRHHPRTDGCAVGLFLLHPGHRRRGLGTVIAAKLLAEASAQGYRLVTANVTDGWEPGRAFLASLGFTFAQPRAPGGNRNTGPSERAVLPARLEL